MSYMSTHDASSKWGIGERRIRGLCCEGRIKGAIKIGRNWSIPMNAHKPSDKRMKAKFHLKGIEDDFFNIDQVKETMERMKPPHLSDAVTLCDQVSEEYALHGILFELDIEVDKESLSDGVKSAYEIAFNHFGALSNHYQALLCIKNMVINEEPMTTEALCDIHAILLCGVDNDHKGKFRSVNISNEDEPYPSCDHTEIQRSLDQLFHAYHTAWCNDHPLVKGSILLGEYLRIRPFIDGDWYISRLLLNYVLMSHGFPPIIIRNSFKKQYESIVFELMETKDYQPLITYVSILMYETQQKWLKLFLNYVHTDKSS